MQNDEFNRIMDDLRTRLDELLNTKQAEYATEDRLHNFRKAADLTDDTMRRALGGFMLKHTVSIYDMIKDRAVYNMEKWDEKIMDHIVYLMLLKAVIVEEETKRFENTIDYAISST